MSAPQVTVRFGDDALAELVAHAAGGVRGVVRLQRRPSARAMARGRVVADASAVELGRDAAGVLEVSIRLVSALRPSPLQVVRAVGEAVSARLAEVGERAVRVEVTVTDVRG